MFLKEFDKLYPLEEVFNLKRENLEGVRGFGDDLDHKNVILCKSEAVLGRSVWHWHFLGVLRRCYDLEIIGSFPQVFCVVNDDKLFLFQKSHLFVGVATLGIRISV